VDTDAETALVCEPDSMARDKIKKALRTAGYQTMEAKRREKLSRACGFTITIW